MSTTLVVAANGFTRDHVSIVLDRLDPYRKTGVPVETVDVWHMDTGIVRFVTDNDLDDGVFQVVGEDV